jgi:hypothetical protein
MGTSALRFDSGHIDRRKQRKLLKRLEKNYARGGGGSGRDGRTRISENCGSVTFPVGTGAATTAALGAGGVRPKIEPRTVMA